MLRAVAALALALSPGWRRALGTMVGWFFGGVVRYRRRHVELAMSRAEIPQPRAVARAMYRQLGVSIVDLLRLSAASAAERAREVRAVELAGAPQLDRALASGPVIVFASHTGNWELAAAAATRWVAARGREALVVAKPLHDRGVDRFVGRLRAGLGVRTIAPRGAYWEARRALARGDVVIMPIDQAPPTARAYRTSHRVEFLGASAYVDRAPPTLLFRSRASALVVAAERIDSPRGTRNVVHVLDTIAPPTSADRARPFIDGVVERASRALDRFVRERPASWLWLHRRWKESPRASRSSPLALES